VICSLCGLETKDENRKSGKMSVCKDCRAYFAEKREYSELLLRIFIDDPSLNKAIA
jgi:hypothetical protein